MFPYSLEPTKIYNPPQIPEIHIEEIFNFGHYALFDDENDYFFFILERRNCKVLNKKDLTSFFNEKNIVKNDILLILEVILSNFGDNQKTSIELFIDEDEEGPEEVFVNIIFKEDSEENIEKFNRVNNWFIDNIYKYRQFININIDFE
ncbi:hypothetical protein KAJ61_04180 [Candidatus Parcubacteria bacterium]|nr:hypothetical protein [Candidatus Parcubacteria bacterium]